MRTSIVCILLGIINLVIISTAFSDLEETPLFMDPVETTILSGPGKNKQDDYIDFVLVRKKERKLYLYTGHDVVKSYKIALGKEPVGQKQREGDSRTPEGLYTLDWRNPNSRFFRSIHVSYPNVVQARSAKEAGIDPGGEIMIHGQPSDWSERIKLTFNHKDWTEGCIAVENQDMLEIWDLVRDGTPIKIEP